MQKPAIILTEDTNLHESPIYLKIEKILNKMYQEGLIDRVRHNCISASQILQKLLDTAGIKSKTVECTLSMFRSETEYAFIGFDDYSFPGEIDTHVVVITETYPRIIIDISLAHLLPSIHPCVVEGVNSTDPDVIGEYIIEGIKMTYNVKKNSKIPHIHQKTLIQQFEYEEKTTKSLSILSKVLIVAVLFGIINFCFNAWIVILRHEGNQDRELILQNQALITSTIESIKKDITRIDEVKK